MIASLLLREIIISGSIAINSTLRPLKIVCAVTITYQIRQQEQRQVGMYVERGYLITRIRQETRSLHVLTTVVAVVNKIIHYIPAHFMRFGKTVSECYAILTRFTTEGNLADFAYSCSLLKLKRE